MRRLLASLLAGPLLIGAAIPSSPDLGKAAGQCRANETGPAFIVDASGLKDRKGLLKLEVYPANNDDFLADDNVLIMAGKTFRRVEIPITSTGHVQACIRLPAAGRYAVSVLHDRDANRKFGWRVDGIGFSGNPKLGLSEPTAAKASAIAGPGLTKLSIVLNYQHGLGMRPLSRTD